MSRPATAYINLSHLAHNYHVLKRQAGKAQLMAVVKANAYGHGLDLAAPTLFAEGCRSFAVTDAVEGARLRHIIGNDADIVLLSGVFDEHDAQLSHRHNLMPVLTEPEQIRRLHAAGFHGRVWIKVDTGMRRLGAADPQAMVKSCGKHGIDVVGMMSHLACADIPGHALNREQVQNFSHLMQDLPDEIEASLLNSAGLAAWPQYSYDTVRPGIALYGVEPATGIDLGLRPVMQLTGKVMQIRKVLKGEGLSYGASYIARQDMVIAVVCLGYADGLPRCLSNKGYAIFQDARLPIVGRICMDYCLLDVGEGDIGVDDEVEFWGESLTAAEVAESAGTIAYELFTRVGSRVHRAALP